MLIRGAIAGLVVLLAATSAQAEQGTAPPPAPPPPTAVAPAPPASPPPPAVVVPTPSPAVVVVPPGAYAPVPPPVMPQTPPPPAAGSRLPPGFLDQVLTYDDASGHVVEGRARRPLTREELFTALDRPDLLEQSRAAARRRTILAVSGAAVFVVGMIVGIVPRLDLPNLNSAYCDNVAPGGVPNYNTVCVPDYNRRVAISTAGFVGGIAIGGALVTAAIVQSPDVLSKDQTTTLISEHNGLVLKRMRGETSSIHVAPYASAKGGGVVTVVDF